MPLAGFPKGNIGLPFDPALGLGAIDIDAEDEGRIRAIRNIYGGSSWVRVGKKSKPSLLRTSRPGSRETESQAAGTTGIGPVLLGAEECQSPAVKERKRCRMHGETNPGAPKGNRNARKHGGRSAEAMQMARYLREIMRIIDRAKGQFS